jgi:hypothetical protein
MIIESVYETELVQSGEVELPAAPREWFKFYSPGECREYQPPEGYVLVGDCHIVRGSVTVIAGAPGIGKSRAGTALAVAGATGQDWFGLKVHHRFKTAILQGENGRYRLKTEFADLDETTLNEYIRVSDRPPYGLAFDSFEFRQALTAFLNEFKPDVLLLDPWNGIVRDERQKDYREAFDHIFDVLPKSGQSPAIVIVAHTRKPQAGERRTGRALLHELSGSHSLGSVPRCVFVMEAASDDEADGRVVWTCCKNNDGEAGSRTAWLRGNGLFAPCRDFDWETFDAPPANGNPTITQEDVSRLFEQGRRRLALKTAVAELQESTGFGRTACYSALELKGRFRGHLAEDADGLLQWIP